MTELSTKIELSAVIVRVAQGQPQLALAEDGALPTGPFETGHRTMEQGLRAWAGMKLGYVEQLYTFADRDRTDDGRRVVSIGYVALVRQEAPAGRQTGKQAGHDPLWSDWYRHFPWEDHRQGVPTIIGKHIMPRLREWKGQASSAQMKRDRAERIDSAFPADMRNWHDEYVLQRYELLWEAGLVPEAGVKQKDVHHALGAPLPHDHRRIVATAIARLRAKIKYRPVVFELLPDQFTLLQLQETVEALAGLRLHKQNFRRLVEAQGLVEETGGMARGSSGRPAKLFAFRRQILRDRAVAGTKLPRV
ncbi:MAG: hypothetical protein JO126_03195 [Alphaproteobacteria bacterium]|nr:hypothetical protein [Alphaproteobacteria bacterium]MBV8548446.1 hypothetical protein [Alphaproteobacteria bacterium]